MDISWKRIIYLICAIQVGAGITIIGVLSFIPLYLVDLGLTNQGEAAMWAGLVSGVTPCMVALSAPFWSRKANELGPRRVMMFILATLMLAVGAAGFVQTTKTMYVDVCCNEGNKIQTVNPNRFLTRYRFCHIANPRC